MSNEDNQVGLSPTVLHVIEQFASAMRTDNGINDDAIEQLEKLLQKGSVPKPDEINAALFDLSPDGET